MSKPLETAEAPLPVRSIKSGYEKRLMISAGRASRELGGKIAEKLEVELTDAGLKTFADGEVYCRYAESIRGADLFIVQSMCGSEREGMTPNDSLWELLLMVHAAKHASAHRIIAVSPWYGYSRQDKKSAPREPISARLVADTLEVAGIDRLVTMDLHAGQLQGFFSKPVDHMTAMPILTQFVIDRLGSENLVIIAPDAGRVKLVRKFAQKVGAPYALMEKERPAQQVAEIGYVIGDVKGKTAVIVDDIIGTGSTLSAAAQTVLDEGAERVFAVATHGLFSGNAFENLVSGPLDGIVVTDTVPLREGAPDLITQLTCADILEDSIRRIFTDDSVSEIFAGENQLFCSSGRAIGGRCRDVESSGARTPTAATCDARRRWGVLSGPAGPAGPGALLLAELRGGRFAEPPLAADPVPVAGGVQLAEHGKDA